MERCRNTQRTCKHAYAQTSPHILIQKANSNDMLIWCVTSEEGRNQASAHEATSTTTTEKKLPEQEDKSSRLANTFESARSQEMYSTSVYHFRKRIGLLAQIFIQHYLLNFIKIESDS